MGAIGKAELVMRVLENLSKKGGFSAIELNEHFKSTMNETTVYRILKGPEDEGILHFFKGIDRLQGTAGCEGRISLLQTDMHPHFHCWDCGQANAWI